MDEGFNRQSRTFHSMGRNNSPSDFILALSLYLPHWFSDRRIADGRQSHRSPDRHS